MIIHAMDETLVGMGEWWFYHLLLNVGIPTVVYLHVLYSDLLCLMQKFYDCPDTLTYDAPKESDH